MTFVEFLLARIAEDEAAAQAMNTWNPDALLNGKRLAPKMLAACEAKRRILAVCTEELEEGNYGGEWVQQEVRLALVSEYADHPDFKEEWRS